MLAVGRGDVELECMATWNDRSQNQTYLYGRLSGIHDDDDDDDGYRCFVRIYTHTVFISQQ